MTEKKFLSGDFISFIAVFAVLMFTSTVKVIASDSNLFSGRKEYSTGIILGIRGNSFLIEDERDKTVRRFYYVLSGLSDFRAGDRVRVYFELRSQTADSIVRMRPVEYIKGRQNAGYIYKKDEKQ